MSVLNALQRKYTLVGFKGPVTLQDIVDTAIAGGSGGGGGGDGVSVTGATIDANGDLIITLSDSSTLNAGRARGVDGADGQDGATGAKGDKGDKGDTGAAGTNGTNGTNGQGVPTGGTTGQILAKTSNADFATQWIAAPSGGGGTGKPWYWNPPVAADFTLLSGDANSLTLTNDADVGLMIKSGPIVGGSGDTSRIAVKPIPNPAANWDIKVHALTFSDGQDYTKILPLVLRDSVGGRMTTMAMTNEYITYANINLASLTAYGGAVGDGFMNKGGAPLWFRVACVGTTLTYYVSMDGKNWLDVATAGVTSYLANRPNQVGFGANFNKTVGKKAVITIDHFSITQ